jgi:quercetin dioxygenase-like cupin family protein
MMAKIDLDGLAVKTLAPGFDARLIHTERMTLSYVHCEAGAELPEHSHPNEQVVNVLSGELELIVEGERHVLKRGLVFVLPPDMPHSGVARTQCEVLDIFCPPREDLK